jgi:hypothetical protein
MLKPASWARAVIGEVERLVDEGVEIEQPRILDRDDRLIGKGAHQFDLPIGIRLHSLPPDRNHADHDPSRNSGTPRQVRYFPSVTASVTVNSGSEATSATWMTWPSSTVRPVTDLRSAVNNPPRINASC